METGKPYPLKALYIHGSNPLVQMADHHRIKRAFLKMNFISVADFFLTETAQIADIVLPAATWLEWDNVKDSFQQSYDSIGFQRKLVQIEECKSDITIFCELAKRLSLDYWKSEKELMDYRVRTLGNGFDEVARRGRITFPMVYRKYEKKGFNTPSGKIELSSKRLKDLGGDPVPFYTESPESPHSQPQLAENYPLILTTGGRKPVYRHSEGRRIPWLRQMTLRQEVGIHPEKASELGIENGEEVILESPRGELRAVAFFSVETEKDCIQVCPGWEGEWNVNRLTTLQYCAPLVGTYLLRGLLCNIKKAKPRQ
jgi:anaerobic selenocysteine-containing dehydrogenase